MAHRSISDDQTQRPSPTARYMYTTSPVPFGNWKLVFSELHGDGVSDSECTQSLQLQKIINGELCEKERFNPNILQCDIIENNNDKMFRA